MKPFLCALGLVGLTILIFGSGFEASDDALMMLIASGIYYNGSPSSNLVFMHPLIGKALAAAYGYSLRIPWYGLFLYVIHTLSLTLILDLLWRVRAEWPLKTFVTTLALLLFANMIVNLQFTSVAMSFGFAVACNLLSRVRSNSILRGDLFCLSVLFCTASLIRMNTVFYCLLFLFPLLLLWGFNGYLRALLPWLGTVLIFSLLGLNTPRPFYSEASGWRQFYNFNDVRGLLHDVEVLRQTINVDAVIEKANWSCINRDMFQNWFFSNEKIFSEESVSRLASAARSYVLSQPLPWPVYFLDLFTAFFVPCLMVCAILIISVYSRRAAIGWVATFSLVIMTYLLTLYKLPERFAWPVFLFLILSPLVIPGTADSRPFSKPAKWTLALLAFLISISSLSQLWLKTQETRQAQQTFLTLFTNLRQQYPAKTLIISGNGVSFAMSPFADLSTFPKLPWISLGWDTRSPDWKNLADSYSLHDLEHELATNDRLLWIARPEAVKVFQDYMQTHTGLTPTYDILPQMDGLTVGFNLFQLRQRGVRN